MAHALRDDLAEGSSLASTNEPTPAAGPARDQIEQVRRLRWEFAAAVEPHRPALYAHCRKLTGDPFDAEDLHQEALLRAFSRLAVRFEPIVNPRAWLFRVATNLWIDTTRRRVRLPQQPIAPDAVQAATAAEAPGPELVDAAPRFLHALPRKEAMSLVLCDVLGYSMAQAADFLACSEASVKMAASRARRRLAASREDGTLSETPPDPGDVAERFARALRERDASALVALIDEHACARVLGCAEEEGRDEIVRGSLRYALATDQCVDTTAIRWGERDLLAMWYAREDGGDPVVRDLWRLTVVHGQVVGLDHHFFSPDLLAEVCGELGLAFETNGYAVFERGWWNDQR